MMVLQGTQWYSSHNKYIDWMCYLYYIVNSLNAHLSYLIWHLWDKSHVQVLCYTKSTRNKCNTYFEITDSFYFPGSGILQPLLVP